MCPVKCSCASVCCLMRDSQTNSALRSTVTLNGWLPGKLVKWKGTCSWRKEKKRNEKRWITMQVHRNNYTGKTFYQNICCLSFCWPFKSDQAFINQWTNLKPYAVLYLQCLIYVLCCIYIYVFDRRFTQSDLYCISYVFFHWLPGNQTQPWRC